MTGRDVEPKKHPSEVKCHRTGQYWATNEWTAKGQMVALCHGAVPQGGRELDEGERKALLCSLTGEKRKMTRQEKHGDSKGKRMAIPETHVRFPMVIRPERVVRAARCKGSSLIMWFWPSDPAPEILMDLKISYKIARRPP